MRIQRAIRPASVDQSIAGYWRVMVTPPNGKPIDISMFRGIPISIGSFTFADPFGAGSFGIDFPQVTIFDRLGFGDLNWAVKGADLDVLWVGDLPASYPFGSTVNGVWKPAWRWEGYISTFNWTSESSSSTMSVQAKGAGYQLDNWLAKPEYLSRPMPYEFAIARQFLGKPSLQLAALKIVWPPWWNTVYRPVVGAPSYMIPTGVTQGSKWTALLTRATGTWDPVLTSYIQSMLISMYTRRGRWTLDFNQGRQPVLWHRDILTKPSATTVVIDPVLPDNSISLSEDWEQSLTTVYGQGTSVSGVAYTGMEVSGDGSTTTYVPLASLHQVYPTKTTNGWYDKRIMAKEASIQMQPGLNADDAAQVGRAHLAMFSEPGLTGTITIGVDPMMNGQKIPRHLVRAGMQVLIPGLFGRPSGVLLHIASSSHTLDKTTLTVDSKFRDALTVNEVRLRGKDSLSVNRMLIGGAYSPPVSDQLVPWNYAAGSGFIPSNASYSAVRLFAGMPADVTFPWESWTKMRPPSAASWRTCYLRIGPRNAIANNNWTVQDTHAGRAMAIPIKLSQSGTARLLQIAAYDKNGKVMKVPFHIGLYSSSGTNVLAMPQIPAEQASLFPPYKAGQKFPFVRGAWETIRADGTKDHPDIPQPTSSTGLIKTWGNFYEKAGYFPGQYVSGDRPTGLLVDESSWTWDLTGIPPFNFQDSAVKNSSKVGAGMVYLMIYCDAQGPNEVFFMGRIFRVEPGTGGS